MHISLLIPSYSAQVESADSVLAEDEGGPDEETDAIFAASFNPVRTLCLNPVNTRSAAALSWGRLSPRAVSRPPRVRTL